MKFEMNPTEVLHALTQESKNFAWIDVRSEGEYLEGHIPGFKNYPILNNDERAQVGTTYKQEGQERAIALGHALVKDSKNSRVDAWVSESNASSTRSAIVSCWRGGLRSKTSCEWLEAKGVNTHRVLGGYKALRNLLLEKLSALPSFVIVSGLTGSGKTKLLKTFPSYSLDLEYHAHHRGSTFGMQIRGDQPRQATFENRILLELYRKNHELLLEDESLRIGQVQIPLIMKEKMTESPVIWLEVELHDRIKHIADEYVIELLQNGFSADEVHSKLDRSLVLLKKKLGSALTTELQKELKKAFDSNPLDPQSHQAWIEPLLTRHYDKLYDYSFKKNPRTILFRGPKKECEAWIQNRFV